MTNRPNNQKILADAYEVIDGMTAGLRRFVEEHLEQNPHTERFNLLVLLDDGKGGTTIAHTYQNSDGSPDLREVLIGLTLAWRNLQATGGSQGSLGQMTLEEIVKASRRQ